MQEETKSVRKRIDSLRVITTKDGDNTMYVMEVRMTDGTICRMSNEYLETKPALKSLQEKDCVLCIINKDDVRLKYFKGNAVVNEVNISNQTKSVHFKMMDEYNRQMEVTVYSKGVRITKVKRKNKTLKSPWDFQGIVGQKVRFYEMEGKILLIEWED